MRNGLTNNVIAFAQTNNMMQLVEKFVDYFNHYCSEVKGNNGVNFVKDISLDEKSKKLHENIEEAINKISGVNNIGFSEVLYRSNPMYQWAAFAVISAMIESVLPDTLIEELPFAEVRNGGYGDSFTFDIKPNDLFVVTKAGNGKRHVFAQRQYNGQATLIPENHMITVEEDLYRILSGKRNLAEYALKIMQSIATEISYDVYSAIDGTYSALPTQFKEAAYDQDTFVTLCQRVKGFNGGAKTSVFGTQLALSKVAPSNLINNNNLGEKFYTTGYLGTFMGVDLFEIPQKVIWNSATYAMKLDDTRLYVVSAGVDKLVKVGIEGETISYTTGLYDNANLTVKQTMHKKWKVGLISSSKFGIIDLS
jgi:hypothetical protein